MSGNGKKIEYAQIQLTKETFRHCRRYLETYLPESGVEFALTTRYKRAIEQSSEAQTSKAGLEEAQARADEEARQQAAASKHLGHSSKGKSRILGENGIALGTTKADLCVVATKPFKAGDLILMCKGGVKDLTKSEDEALREEAAVDRERQKEQDYNGVLGQGRDFSVIRSARKGCSQLLLGPARFVNHDCDPTCEFYRLGSSQMVFKCLRNIGLNEEITTYYGDNYFEWENSECMCRTCEERSKGFFSPKELEGMTLNEAEPLTKAEAKQRRTSQRLIVNPSPPPGRTAPEPTTTTFEKNGKITTKTFHHHVSQREFDEDSTTHRGPKCTCLTCGTSFWAPEAWWMPDECRRCERHYRIFKADWPGRLPTEGGWSARAKMKRREIESNIETKNRKSLHAPSPGISSSNSEADTPIKLSPLRDTEADEEPVKPKVAKKRRRLIPTDDGTDEEAIDAALRGPSPKGYGKKVDRADDESDLTSVSDEGDADHSVLPTMTRRSTPSSAASDASSTSSKPSGPKMLGKEAKTETLALYWGAPTGDRRKSRPSQTGLESLSNTVRKEALRHLAGRKEHRRNVSDISTASAPTKPSLQHRTPSGTEDSSQPRRESLPDLDIPASVEESSKSSHSPTVVAAEILQQSTGEQSPIQGSFNLATKGPARTSVKNLALAWSAGVDEGGRGSRRRQPRDVSQSIATSVAVSTIPRSKRKSVSKEESGEPDGSVTKKEAIVAPIEDVSISVPPQSFVSETKDTPVARSASPTISIVETHSRNASPLQPPATIAFANRPGITPGKPIRKNLRWGSGKVSTSRPFVGSAASFPGAPSSPAYTSNTETQPSKLISPGYLPRTVSQGSAFNVQEENIIERETPSPSPMTFKDRRSSPLVRAALHASIASSTQLQNMTNNGNSGYPSNSNGTTHSIKHRPASPISLMGPPRPLQHEGISPTSEITQAMVIPKLESDPDQPISTGQHNQQVRSNGRNDLQHYSMQGEEVPRQ